MRRLAIGIIGFLLLVAFIILVWPSGGKRTPTEVTPVLKPLPSYSTTDATVSMQVNGPVVADENYREVIVTVGQSQRSLRVIQGYVDNTLLYKTWYNNEPAYNTFLNAINYAGFTTKLKGTKYTSEVGVCPLGYISIFTLNQTGEELSRLWSSSCGKAVGTLGGNSPLLQELFKNQIPEYSKLTSDYQLYY